VQLGKERAYNDPDSILQAAQVHVKASESAAPLGELLLLRVFFAMKKIINKTITWLI
jgi:hypothetical protein